MKNKIIPLVLALVLCVSLFALNVFAFGGYSTYGEAYIPSLYQIESVDGSFLFMSSGTYAIPGTTYEEFYSDDDFYADSTSWNQRDDVFNVDMYVISYNFSTPIIDSMTLSFPDVYLSDSSGSTIIGSAIQLYNLEYPDDLLRPGYVLTGNYLVFDGESYVNVPFETISMADSEGYVFVSFDSSQLPSGCVGVTDISCELTDVTFNSFYIQSSYLEGSRWTYSPDDILYVDNTVVNPDIFAWLSSSVQGFLDIPIFAENITFGSLLIILVSVPLAIAFLKFFAGG